MQYYKTLHKDFKFNGSSYSEVELLALSDKYIAEGKEYQQAIGTFLKNWLNDDSFVKVNTSGSTGQRKEIILPKSKMINSALATGEFFQLMPKQKALLCLSADYIAGKMMLVRAMVLGLEIDCIEPSSSPLRVNDKQYHFCAMVPLQVANSISGLSKVKTLIVGGAAISTSLNERLQNTTCEVYATYGMTETITHIALKKINHLSLDTNASVYKAITNVTFTVDERNCIVVHAPNVSDEIVVTNDVVNLISKTEFKWLGRFDNVINSGGVKLFPEQIEAKLEKLISHRFFVAGIPDDQLGQKLILIIEGNPDLEKLREAINNSVLDIYEKPKEIILLPKFKETATGKIQRANTLELI
ncbi:AMP-binding protein [Aurantibacter sp.]|uniref:AMP-binding protein n=1 Tax=Aurantibacter sp. TaxID=2807103 RepID=UPI0032665598